MKGIFSRCIIFIMFLTGIVLINSINFNQAVLKDRYNTSYSQVFTTTYHTNFSSTLPPKSNEGIEETNSFENAGTEIVHENQNKHGYKRFRSKQFAAQSFLSNIGDDKEISTFLKIDGYYLFYLCKVLI